MIAMGVLAMVLAQAMNVLSIEATLVARLRSVSEQGDQHQPKRGTVGQSLPGGQMSRSWCGGCVRFLIRSSTMCVRRQYIVVDT
jgi:hypothetical protein